MRDLAWTKYGREGPYGLIRSRFPGFVPIPVPQFPPGPIPIPTGGVGWKLSEPRARRVTVAYRMRGPGVGGCVEIIS